MSEMEERLNRLHRLAAIMSKVNEEADKFYGTSQELGSLAAVVFPDQGGDNEESKHRAQLTGLENIAETTMKVSDVLDYIKRQMARRLSWTKVHEGKRFGESLKNYI